MKTDAAKRQASFILRYALQNFGLVVLLAVLIRIFFISSFVMSGSSMLPNVWPGDFLIGLKSHRGEPKRGDVVVLRCPNGRERLCLKRVIGLPGDRIEFHGARLLVNGKNVSLRPLGSEFFEEEVNGDAWATWPDPSGKDLSPVVIPPDSIYVLNDKRSEPEDSRSWGPVPTTLMEAKVAKIWLSLDWFNSSGEVRVWPRVRWDRMGRRVD